LSVGFSGLIANEIRYTIILNSSYQMIIVSEV
jgi:hypothetical protein